jgi:5'-deoxynucleotidase
MVSSFFALLSRMKYISRWALMRNVENESLSEHSLETAVIAHCLVTIHNTRFLGTLSAERAATLALFHDMPEVLTGDLPTPVKYHSSEVREAYQKVEESACRSLLRLLPEDLRETYTSLLVPQEGESALWKFVKAADKLSALIKCIEEQKAGNTEFRQAYIATLQALQKMNLPEVGCFITEFLPAFEQPLDGMIDGRC